jgi:hypothetical protein
VGWRRLRIHYPTSNRIAHFRQNNDLSHGLGQSEKIRHRHGAAGLPSDPLPSTGPISRSSVIGVIAQARGDQHPYEGSRWVLYHGTSTARLKRILEDGRLRTSGTDDPKVSLTTERGRTTATQTPAILRLWTQWTHQKKKPDQQKTLRYGIWKGLSEVRPVPPATAARAHALPSSSCSVWLLARPAPGMGCPKLRTRVQNGSSLIKHLPDLRTRLPGTVCPNSCPKDRGSKSNPSGISAGYVIFGHPWDLSEAPPSGHSDTTRTPYGVRVYVSCPKRSM